MITNDPTQPLPNAQEPVSGPGTELSRKGFIITYPMFRYWGKESVEEGLAQKPLNLYVHTPYCIQRCAYCYFKTTTLKDNRLQEIDRYVNSVCMEIELISQHYDLKNRPIETVYFGGGTPTLLTEENIDKLFNTLRANFSLGDAQITFEGEPVTLTERKAALLKKNNVKRISLGIQSFKEEVVFQTGRRDTEEQTFKAIALAKSTGAEVNIDLISGLPGETAEYWAYSVKRAIEADVHNITVYKLELYANTPYYSAEKKKEVTLPSEEDELGFYQYAMAELKAAGYLPVNTFTFAKGGSYDQQNTRSKWLGNDNCAVGVSAFGSLGRWNYQNTSDISAYTEMVEKGELPALRGYICNSLDLMVRDVVMGIKLVHLNHLNFQKKHGFDMLRICSDELAQLEEEGFLTVGNENVSLTDHGILYGDYVGRVLEGAFKRLSGASSGSGLASFSRSDVFVNLPKGKGAEMQSEMVVEKIKRIVVDDLDVNVAYEDLDETVPLFEEGLGLDSVVLVELISFIEKRFNIELGDEALNMDTFKNLQSVAQVICEQLARQQPVA